MLKVKRTKQNPCNIEGTYIFPGVNVITDKVQVKKITENETFKNMVKSGVHVIMNGDEKGSEDKPLSVSDRVALVEEILSVQQLEAMAVEEEKLEKPSKKVLKAIEKKIEELTSKDPDEEGNDEDQ